MTIEQLKEKIKSIINEEPNILFVTRTGSHIFCENCLDIDYKVVVSNKLNNSFKFYDSETKEDYFVKSIEEYNKFLNFETNKLENIFILDELFKKQCCVYGDNTINLKLLENSNSYKEMLKTILSKSFLNPRIKWKDSDKYCHRHLWWAIIGLKMIENQSYEITSEMKDIIQKCHDGILDKSFENWILEKLG